MPAAPSCLVRAWPKAWLLHEQENLWHWMMDPRGRDQFVIRYQGRHGDLLE